MKWVAWAVLALGVGLNLWAGMERVSISRERSKWLLASNEIDRFTAQVPDTLFGPDENKVIKLAIPDDQYWRLFSTRLKPVFYVCRANKPVDEGRAPDNPLAPYEAEFQVNGVPLPFTKSNVENQGALCREVRLGDRIELRLRRPASHPPSDNGLRWGVDFRGGKEDNPGFGWLLGELFADVASWMGFGLVAAVALVALYGKPMATWLRTG